MNGSRLEAESNGRNRRAMRKAARYLLLACLLLMVFLGVRKVPPFDRWSLNSLFMAAALLTALLLRFEERKYGAREVAVVGALAAVGAAGRVLFAAVPGVQPVTFLAVLAGYVLGSDNGFLVGALAGFLSNLFLGQGPWTPWQMMAWGLAGASGGMLSRLLQGRVRRVPIGILAAAWGFLFGWLMNLWFWLSFIYPLTWASFMAACVSSFWFDLLHAGGNLLFALALTVPMASMLERYRRRFDFQYLGEGGAVGSGALRDGQNGLLPGNEGRGDVVNLRGARRCGG